LVPGDILKISGPEAVQAYLVDEVQKVYRTQRVEIDDKHIEIIVSQMLRKVQVKNAGDTSLLPGSQLDSFVFDAINDRLVNQCVKVIDPGDRKSSRPGKSSIVPTMKTNAPAWMPDGKKLPKMRLAGKGDQVCPVARNHQSGRASESFISAASFQETTKVLTEAALQGKVDYLVGLKENVILGHLIPAGTGFRLHQDAEVRLKGAAAEDTTAEAVEEPSEVG
jgi:DNA-directed RNA polymerase subunit beta'